MYRPKNGTLIIPKVFKLEDGSLVTIVRRIVLKNGFMVSKDLLLPDGEWVNIPEGGRFPKEVFIKSGFIDCIDSGRILYNWPRYNVPKSKEFPKKTFINSAFLNRKRLDQGEELDQRVYNWPRR